MIRVRRVYIEGGSIILSTLCLPGNTSFCALDFVLPSLYHYTDIHKMYVVTLSTYEMNIPHMIQVPCIHCSGSNNHKSNSRKVY